MKAWEIAGDLFWNAKPRILSEDDQTWKANEIVSDFYDTMINLEWASNVPGSGAPEKIMVASVQAMENRGYKVSQRGYELLSQGIEAEKKKDFVSLHMISAELKWEISKAAKDEESPYWQFAAYNSFEEYSAKVKFPAKKYVDVETSEFREKIKASWLSQMIGGAMGTMVEGYTSENLHASFGEIYDYLREPNTYNDDITYEIAFLEAFKKYGYDLTSKDLALYWVGYIPSGWSAEEIALKNIRTGIMPPESGTLNNPFNEWIGAQMKGGICGMAAPGDPFMAAKLAWADGEVAHANNGILGEVFNAVMTSLAFCEKDVKEIVKTAISLIPCDSEYFSVVKFAYECSLKYEDWHDALKASMEKYKKYNWIHAYPNACCEIIALMYGNGDFKETLHIVTMCGVDVDCNAAMICPIIAIINGIEAIPKNLVHSAFSEPVTYMREIKKTSLQKLTDDTVYGIKNAITKKEEI